MYVGDNSSAFFPLNVNAAQGSDRVFRYTSLQGQSVGSSATVGTSIVGWEWDARVANGSEPSGVKTLASSPVSGNIIQSNGTSYLSGPATSNAAKYTASSGALVFSTGTNQWARELALNGDGAGEPDARIQQVTTNVLCGHGSGSDDTRLQDRARRSVRPGGRIDLAERRRGRRRCRHRGQ